MSSVDFYAIAVAQMWKARRLGFYGSALGGLVSAVLWLTDWVNCRVVGSMVKLQQEWVRQQQAALDEAKYAYGRGDEMKDIEDRR